MRSSRDRVARGTWMNFLIAIFICLLCPSCVASAFGEGLSPAWLALFAFLGFLLSFAMWIFFEASSYTYELRLAKFLDERRRASIGTAANGDPFANG